MTSSLTSNMSTKHSIRRSMGTSLCFRTRQFPRRSVLSTFQRLFSVSKNSTTLLKISSDSLNLKIRSHLMLLMSTVSMNSFARRSFYLNLSGTAVISLLTLICLNSLYAGSSRSCFRYGLISSAMR